jgi:hypothetical protein
MRAPLTSGDADLHVVDGRCLTQRAESSDASLSSARADVARLILSTTGVRCGRVVSGRRKAHLVLPVAAPFGLF